MTEVESGVEKRLQDNIRDEITSDIQEYTSKSHTAWVDVTIQIREAGKVKAEISGRDLWQYESGSVFPDAFDNPTVEVSRC